MEKLTVKDIVEECHITRQTFYYHFEDIPALIQWVLDRSTEKMLKEIQQQDNVEDKLRYFFLTVLDAAPYIKKGMSGSYRDELDRLITQNVYYFFEQAYEKENLYSPYNRKQLRFILRYHTQAILGVLREWTEEDTKNLDEIVHLVSLLIKGDATP
ncbi:MAG: TetR/AcrR family transcriptional regulator [Lachnospiraceae bacterium]